MRDPITGVVVWVVMVNLTMAMLMVSQMAMLRATK